MENLRGTISDELKGQQLDALEALGATVIIPPRVVPAVCVGGICVPAKNAPLDQIKIEVVLNLMIQFDSPYGAINHETYPVDGQEFRVALHFAHDYPRSRPQVFFKSPIRHYYIHPQTNAPGPLFGASGPKADAPNTWTIVKLVSCLHDFLRAPIDPCQSEACRNTEDSTCTQGQEIRTQHSEAFWAYAADHFEMIARLEALKKFRRHKILYTVGKNPEEDTVRRTGFGCASDWVVPELRAALKARERQHSTTSETYGGTCKSKESTTPGKNQEPSKNCLRSLLREEAPGVYSFALFTPEFCQMLVEEIDAINASGIPIDRPNSMNNYGLILNAVGLHPAFSSLQSQVFNPIAQELFPEVGCGYFDSHHTFVVQYEPGKDLGLDMHSDSSDVTFNCCLGKEFTGAPLVFCGMQGDRKHRKRSLTYAHKIGRCVVHLGLRRHGAQNIKTGQRYNLIMWSSSSLYQQTEEFRQRSLQETQQKEDGPPDAVCLSYTHDRDYSVSTSACYCCRFVSHRVPEQRMRFAFTLTFASILKMVSGLQEVPYRQGRACGWRMVSTTPRPVRRMAVTRSCQLQCCKADRELKRPSTSPQRTGLELMTLFINLLC